MQTIAALDENEFSGLGHRFDQELPRSVERW
jgi:hypothetical protein